MAATQEDVNKACEAIQARGERPTVDRVRDELGGGSPNVLTPLVRTWKEARRQPAGEVPKAAPPVEPGTLPLPIQRAIDGLTTAVANLAPAFAAAVAEVGETERRRSRLEVENALTGASAQVEEARRDADDERSATESVRREVDEKDTEIKRIESELTAVRLERDGLVSAKAAKETALNQEKQAKQEADERARTATEQISAFGGAAQEAREAAARAQGEATTARAEAQRLRDEGTDLRRQLEAAKATVGRLETAVAVARKEAEAEGKQADKADREIERIRGERVAAENSAREAVARAAKAEAEIEAVRGDHARLEQELAAIRAERAAVLEQISTLRVARPVPVTEAAANSAEAA